MHVGDVHVGGLQPVWRHGSMCSACHGGVAHAQAYNEGIEARSRMLELVPPGRVLFLRPLKRGGARVAWDAIWVHASEIIREARRPADLHTERLVA